MMKAIFLFYFCLSSFMGLAQELADSVKTAPPMSLEQIKSKANELRYNRGELKDYAAMKKRKKALEELRQNATMVYQFYLKENSGDMFAPKVQECMSASTLIRGSLGILSQDMEDIESQLGDNAWRVFTRLDIKDIYDPATEKLNIELIKELKENIFFTKKPFNIVSEKSGVGQFLGQLPYKFDGRQGCKGYRVSLGADFNLLMLRLDDGKTIAVVVDKNISSSSYGAIKIIE